MTPKGKRKTGWTDAGVEEESLRAFSAVHMVASFVEQVRS